MSFEEICKNQYEAIYRFLFKMTGQPEAALDLTQETFIKFYEYLEGNAMPENPGAWLYRVVSNLCKNQLKRQNTFHRILLGLFPSDSHITHIEEKVIQDEELAMLRSAFTKPPVRDRLLLQLFQEGLSYAKIAESLQIGKTSVGKMLSRAIEKCAKNMES